MSREILSLKRREDGVFEFYEDSELAEEWTYKDPDEAWGMIIVKILRHLRNISEKRLKAVKSSNPASGQADVVARGEGMKASDTVMNLDELCYLKSRCVTKREEYRPDIDEYALAVRDKQAEISFKVGYDEGARHLNLKDEPLQDKVEAIAVILGEDKYRDSFYGDYVTENDREHCRGVACSILKLCPVPELNVLDWAKDHYWDSLEPQKDLIIKHLESYQKQIRRE